MLPSTFTTPLSSTGTSLFIHAGGLLISLSQIYSLFELVSLSGVTVGAVHKSLSDRHA